MTSIAQIQSAYSKMSHTQQTKFLATLGIKSIKDINSVNLLAAENYMKNNHIDLTDVTVWAKYDQAKQDWATYHEEYVKANKIEGQMKDTKNTAKTKYDKLSAQAVKNNNGQKLSLSQDTAIRNKTNYTTQTIKNVVDAARTAKNWLSKCYAAVNSQRRGYILGVIGERLNIKS